MLRTHISADLAKLPPGEQVTLAGWLSAKLDITPLVIELRDQWGMIRVICQDASQQKILNQTTLESTIQVVGIIQYRQGADGQVTPEVICTQFNILSNARPLPIQLKDYINGDPDFRYRYLTLRRENYRRNIQMVSKLRQFLRTRLEKAGFLEVDFANIFMDVSEVPLNSQYLIPSRLSIAPLLDSIPSEYKKCFQFFSAPIDPHIPPPFGIQGTWLSVGMPECDSPEFLRWLVEEIIDSFAKDNDLKAGRFRSGIQQIGTAKPASTNTDGLLDFIWMHGEPLLLRSSNRWIANKHEFVAPIKDDIHLLVSQPDKVREESFSLLCQNKYLGYAYIRNLDTGVQNMLFELLGKTPEELSEFDPIVSDITYYQSHLCGLELQLEKLAAIFSNENDITNMFLFP